MNLREHNIKILNQLKKTVDDFKLSNPLLVSSDELYLNGLKYNKTIMYIGQESLEWNYNYDVKELEKQYFHTLYGGSSGTEFWKFLKYIIGNDSNYFNNVIWANAMICGEKECMRTPLTNDLLLKVSVENLIYLYKNLKPYMTVIVSGASSPYNIVIREFLEGVNSYLYDKVPTHKNILLSDEVKNIHYTYTPGYLTKKGKILTLSKTLKEFYKK